MERACNLGELTNEVLVELDIRQIEVRPLRGRRAADAAEFEQQHEKK